MKSKLQRTVAQLYSLQNQIRVQLNQLRSKKVPAYPQKQDKSAKKLFANKCKDSTSIINPPIQKSTPTKQESKRLFDRENIVFSQTSRIVQKKHYDRHYAGHVALQNNIRHKTCSYFNITPSKHSESITSHNTSLSGIGMHDKSNLQNNKSRKRIFQDKLVYKPHLI